MNIKKRGSISVHLIPLLLVFMTIIISCCCCCASSDEINKSNSDMNNFLNQYCADYQNSPFGVVCVPANPIFP
jgi:hypothetical protein